MARKLPLSDRSPEVIVATGGFIFAAGAIPMMIAPGKFTASFALLVMAFVAAPLVIYGITLHFISWRRQRL